MAHPRRRGPRTRAVAVVLVTVLPLVVAGCSAAESPGTRPASDVSRPAEGTTVLRPGGPGEPATTLPPDATVRQPRWNSADARFLQMMIPHHAQALRMCALARTRADDPQVSALARRIAGAQGPEILAMSAWLQERGLEVTASPGMRPGRADVHGPRGHGGHAAPDAAAMPGMLTPAQMRNLAEASGSRFDRLFLAAMTRHHEGAVAMADHVLAAGNDLRVAEIAADVSVEQKAEIDRLRAIARRL